MKNILIGIITYKRPQGLRKLLLELKAQKLEGISLSILVVDNDCIGINRKLIDTLAIEYPFSLTLVEEPERGIVAARNKVVSEFLKTDAEALIFIDDDEWPVSDDWIMKLCEAQKEFQSDIVYSDVYTIPESSKIDWVLKNFQTDSDKTDITPTKIFYTNNLLIQRHVFGSLNPPFDQRFAMTGSSDYHFCIRCNDRGYFAVHTPYAPVQELFPMSRATLLWFFLRGYRTGEGSTRTYVYERRFSKAIARAIYYSILTFLRGVGTVIKALILLDKGYLASGLKKIGSSIGSIGGLFRLSYREYKNIHGS